MVSNRVQKPRQLAAQLLSFALVLSTTFIIWKGMCVLTDSPSPIVVVLSGSMEPAFRRGDLVILNNRDIFGEPGVGDVVVYNVAGRDIPIVHRVVRKFGKGVEAQYLTKGDNNISDDTELYAEKQNYLARGDMVGKVGAYIPFVGYVTILLSEYPWLKKGLFGLMALVYMLRRE